MGQHREPEVIVVVNGRPSSGRGRGWGILLAFGVVTVVFGLLLLMNIWGSVRFVAVFAGLLLLAAGVVQTVSALQRRFAGRVVAGVIVFFLGVALIAWPELSAKGIAVLLGCALLFWGATIAITAGAVRAAGWPVVVAPGAVLAVFGLVLIVLPGPTIALLVALLGATVVALGVWLIAKALRLRGARL